MKRVGLLLGAKISKRYDYSTLHDYSASAGRIWNTGTWRHAVLCARDYLHLRCVCSAGWQNVLFCEGPEQHRLLFSHRQASGRSLTRQSAALGPLRKKLHRFTPKLSSGNDILFNSFVRNSLPASDNDFLFLKICFLFLNHFRDHIIWMSAFSCFCQAAPFGRLFRRKTLQCAISFLRKNTFTKRSQYNVMAAKKSIRRLCIRLCNLCRSYAATPPSTCGVAI